MSASTGAPAALARSEGSMLATNGTAVAAPATPPTAPVAASGHTKSGFGKATFYTKPL
jgi:hypothetical protein